MSSREGRFIWYDLMTPDVEAARRFYAAVVGWTIADSGHPTQQYLVLHAAGEEGRGMGGIMATPPGSGLAPHWAGYAYVADVDASAARVTTLGGKVCREPSDIPHVGRFASVQDPQGGSFYLFRPEGPSELSDASTPGHVGWRELSTTDQGGALAFYSALLGWQKEGSHDMGPRGMYDLYATPDGQRGGMMRGASSSWLFYFTVESVDATVRACRREGGLVVDEPHQEPEGGWITRLRDPQGALFAITGKK